MGVNFIGSNWSDWVDPPSIEKHSLGKQYENLAAWYALFHCGYRIKKRNWRTAMGEIDLFASDWKDRYWILIEVRGRQLKKWQWGTLSSRKKNRLISQARFLSKQKFGLKRKWQVEYWEIILPVSNQTLFQKWVFQYFPLLVIMMPKWFQFEIRRFFLEE